MKLLAQPTEHECHEKIVSKNKYTILIVVCKNSKSKKPGWDRILLGEDIRIRLWRPLITINEPQRILTCTNPPEQAPCFFEINGTVEGIILFDDFQIYTFVYPANPSGVGWYIQQPPTIGTNGNWAQGPAILGSEGHPARNGDTLQIQAALVQADARFNETKLSALGRDTALNDLNDIDGIVDLSAPISLTMQR